ncbi:MAG TPA: ETC complex I subunit [Allosphingosinicella sp.]|nr:ETC complex I subunit [Allosphingosinicella sp.]
MSARLFQRSRNAMQSGKAREGEWVLEFESQSPRRPDPLMGWSGGADTQAQVSITFDTLEQAKGYAERYGVDYHLVPPAPRKLRIQSYADNFK